MRPSITPLREPTPRAYGVRDAPGPRGHVARLPRDLRGVRPGGAVCRAHARRPGTCSGSSSARRASPAAPRPRRSVTRSTPSRGASGRCRSTRSWGTRTTWAPTWWCARRSASSWATSSTRAPAGQPEPGLPRRWHQPHVPRRGCGLAAARTHPRPAGNDVVLVAELAGHLRLETTRRYSLPSHADRQQAMDAALEVED